MRRIVLVFLLIVSVVLLFIVPISAHKGGTDSQGGHYDSASGDYHYHHGYSAHDHPGGKCPYDFASGSSLSSNGSSGGGCADSFDGGSFLALIFLGSIALFPFVIFLIANNTSQKTVSNRVVTDSSKHAPKHPATETHVQPNQAHTELIEIDYLWDEDWDDYIETDTEGAKTEDSIEDLYDFYDNLPDI